MEQNEYDVLIVGTGAGGGAVLWRLCEQWGVNGKRIGVVEAGGIFLPTHAMNLPAIGNIQKSYQINDRYSKPFGIQPSGMPGARKLYAVGGKTLIWGTVSPRMLASELVRWPITLKEMNYYYNISEEIMHVNKDFPQGLYFTDIVLKRIRERGFIEADRTPRATKWKASHDGVVNSDVFFSSISFLASALSLRPVDIVIKAHAAKVLYSQGKIGGVEVIGPDKKSNFIRAKTVVVSAGTFNSPRILLNSGLRGNIGHYLTAHSSVGLDGMFNRAEFPELLGELSVLIPQTEERPIQLELVGPLPYQAYQYEVQPLIFLVILVVMAWSSRGSITGLLLRMSVTRKLCKERSNNMTHQTKVDKAIRTNKEGKGRAAKNYWRLQYHVSPPANWMNDPNGFCFFKGEYHLFYQHHPYSPYWDDMHWGHFKSGDLVHWTELPIALAPSEEYDRDGCFSGSAIEKDGILYLMYTGNQWTGTNRDTNLTQVQCLAISMDGITFDKSPCNPVIDRAPEGDIHPYHLRDPKVWKHGGYYYCVLGSRTKEHLGQILLYRSKDMINWEFIGVPAKANQYDNGGYMWECPDLFSLDGHDVLVLSPQGMKPEGDKYHNLHQAGFMLGKLDYNTGKFEHEAFKMLDYGFDFYAPQTMEDGQGRRIMIAWMAMWESEMPEQANGWAGAMTLPRQMSFEQGEIRCRPIPELSKLRGGVTAYENVEVSGKTILDGIAGDCYEMEVWMDMTEALNAGIKLRVNDAKDEQTVLSFHRDENAVTLDRNKSGKGPGGIRKAPVELANGILQLRIFMDRSSVEVFLQDGAKVMTARIYPDETSTGICFFAEGKLKITRLNKWDLSKSAGITERVVFDE